MALRKIALQSSAEDAHKRLDQFLADRLPQALGRSLSKAKVRKLIVAGAVYLNGRRVRIASKELLPRARVEAFIDLERLLSDGPGRDRVFRMGPERVLYEDEYLIAVDKPPGLPTQPTLDEARDNLFAAVKRFLSERDGVAQPYLGLHHRLDRDTSGVVLFTKKAEVNAATAELFTRHLAVKTYYALTHRPQPDVPDQQLRRQWSVENYLGRDRSAPSKRARYKAVRSGGDFAHTDFQLIEAMKDALWIEAMPRTGRTHQIRVHLSEDGLPILADPAYGRKGAGVLFPSRTMLHAVCLTFPHPIHKTKISIQTPLPEDFVQCLRALESRKLQQMPPLRPEKG